MQTSGNIVKGRAFVLYPDKTEVIFSETLSEKENLDLFDIAYTNAFKELDLLSKEDKIFAGHLEMLRDDMVQEGVREAIESGMQVKEAVIQTKDQIKEMFLALDDEYLRSRADDVEDVFQRILRGLHSGPKYSGMFEGMEPGDIIVARRLFPSDLADISLACIEGIILEEGNATSHVCLMAAAHGVSFAVGVSGALEKVKTGDTVIINPEENKVVFSPSEEELSAFYRSELELARKLIRTQLFAGKQLPDGLKVLCNVASVEETRDAMNLGADGVGVFRTEFLFMNRKTPPTEDEQYDIYRRAALCCGDKPITIRTLDVGGDKQIPYLNMPHEENPFLGVRGIRFLQREGSSLFETQLRALLRASYGTSLRIMLPMVSCYEEVADAVNYISYLKSVLYREGYKFNENVPLGVMIETPAAVFILDELMDICDFFSIGTNDLIQYVMAADRTNAGLSYLSSMHRTAAKRAVQYVLNFCKEHNFECEICGDIASSTEFTKMLLDFGLKHFSVSFNSIATIKKEIIDCLEGRRKEFGSPEDI